VGYADMPFSTFTSSLKKGEGRGKGKDQTQKLGCDMKNEQ